MSVSFLVYFKQFLINVFNSRANKDEKFSVSMMNNKTSVLNFKNETNITGKGNEVKGQFEANRKRSFLIYSAIIGASILAITLRTSVYYFFCVRSSLNYHKSSLNSIMSTNMRFFDINPLGTWFALINYPQNYLILKSLKFVSQGRILNRFSRDINNIDELIPLTYFEFLHVTKLKKKRAIL